MLRGAGYVSISSAMDANEVCELHHKHCYDLILLDLEMPSMGFSGFQVMERLRKIEPGDYLPVIVITAHPDHKLHALQAGARDFISKPFELDEALARIRNMLEVRLLYTKMKNRINELEGKLQEVETSRDLILRQRDEINGLRDQG
jgi:adenylate cyclase